MFSEFFIRRPIFATVLSIVIVLIGAGALVGLPISQYPEILPPQISVDANYSGASAEVVADTVAAPLENQINGATDMIYMNSVSSSDGRMSLTVTFETGTDPDDALVEVNNRIAAATPMLPEPVRRLRGALPVRPPRQGVVERALCDQLPPTRGVADGAQRRGV